jgi:hypothetical protein
MIFGLTPPTQIRPISSLEYHIVSGVFGTTLPHPSRILITDAAGLDGRAFTIPTSLMAMISGVNPAVFIPTVLGSYLGSVINVAYLINVGRFYGTLATSDQRLLIHETSHVWQGKNSRFANSRFALTYVFNSVFNQCLHGSGAYFIRGRATVEIIQRRAASHDHRALVPARTAQNGSALPVHRQSCAEGRRLTW